MARNTNTKGASTRFAHASRLGGETEGMKTSKEEVGGQEPEHEGRQHRICQCQPSVLQRRKETKQCKDERMARKQEHDASTQKPCHVSLVVLIAIMSRSEPSAILCELATRLLDEHRF